MSSDSLPKTMKHLDHLKYRPDIDGLRAIAVLVVVGFHAFPSWVKGGFVGVDVFFVISGFLITSLILKNIEQNRFTIADFYRRRIRRIFPALLVVLFACLVIGWFALLGDEYQQLGKHVAAGAGFISNVVLWSEAGYFDNSAVTKPLLHLWSLGIEEQFYIVWPLILSIISKKKLNFLSVTLCIAGLSFVCNLYSITIDPTSAFYLPHSRVWELLLGALLAWLSLPKSDELQDHIARGKGWFGFSFTWFNKIITGSAYWTNIQSLIGMILIFVAILVTTNNRQFPGWWALLPTFGTCFVISAGPNSWINRHLLANKWLVWVGLISFPLYLWHWSLLSFANIVESENLFYQTKIVIVLISVFLAWLTYKLVEKPIRQSPSGNGVSISLFTLMVVIGYGGYNIYQREGLRFRTAAQYAQKEAFLPTYRQKCSRGIFGKFSKDEWCNVGTSQIKIPTAVLLGDSFSNAYAPMLTTFASKTSYAFSVIQFGHAECPPVLWYGPPECQDFFRRALKYIEDSKSINTVILAAKWQAYYKKDFEWNGYTESASNFDQNFEKTISLYQSIGKKVVVLLSPPLGGKPKSCINRPLRMSNRQCYLREKYARRADGDYRLHFLPLLAKQNIGYFDPFKALCIEDTCKLINGTKILYFDGTHLSTAGSEYLAENGYSDLEQLFLK